MFIESKEYWSKNTDSVLAHSEWPMSTEFLSEIVRDRCVVYYWGKRNWHSPVDKTYFLFMKSSAYMKIFCELAPLSPC